nr:MAG TPA: tail protein [Caudoviricetes sp.]
MIIYDSKGEKLLDVSVDDASFRHRAIKGDNTMTLKYSLPDHVELPRGAWCEYQSERYELLNPEAIKMHHTRNFEYTVTLEARQSRLKLWKFRNNVDGRLKFTLTATPREHLEMLVTNLNARDSGWTVGECITTPEKMVSYDHNSCWDALGKMAQEFATEWEIADKRISLRKVEYNKTNPLALAYGFGRGLKTGVGRTASGKTPTEILFVQGGDRNIDPAKYGAKTLHLPKGQTLAYDGSKFEGEAGFVASTARRYKVDAEGLSISRADKALETRAEDSLGATEIYPSRVGVVGSVVAVNTAKHFYDIFDDLIPDALDYEKALIAGETMTIIFQSGQLAGREFEVKYHHKTTKKAGKRFELIPQEIDGVTMPSEMFKPKAGDKYAVFHVTLPQAYVADNATKTGAEWELFRQAVRHLYDNEEQKYTFTGELDGLWAKRDWVNIGGRIILGGYISFRDESFARDGVLLRIVGIKDFVNAPHSPVLELSNDVVGSSFSGGMQKIKDDEALVEEYHKEAMQFTKRRFRDAKETATALIEAALDGFTGKVSPIVVQTMQLLVGDESLQFRFVDNRTSPKKVEHNVKWNKATRQLTIPSGTIQHLTMGIKTLSASHAPSEYKYWDIQGLTSARLDEPDKSYYVYARVEANGTRGTFRIEESARRFNSEAGAYWLLLGLLSSETDGDRSFATVYGFTEVLPGQIRTEKIATPDGSAYFDLQSGVIASKSIRFVYTDGSLHDYPNDYLHKSIREGSTEIQGGLVLGSIIGAKDNTGAVVSYLSGTASLPAFACGVTGFGTPGYKAITELRHNGTGHIGAMHIEQGGEVVTFRPEGSGYTTVRIGGGQAKLEDLKSRSEQDSRGSVQIPRQDHNLTDKEVRKTVTLVSTAVRVLNAGSTMTLSLPVSISAQSYTNWYAEVHSKVEVSVKMESSTGDIAYSKFIGLSFTEEIDYKNPGKPGKNWKASLERTLEDEIVGLQDDIYTLKVEAYMSVDYIKDDFHPDESAGMRLSANPTTGEYRIKGVNSSAREVVFSQQGMSVFFGKKRFFYLQGQATGGDDTFLTVRGKTDMPGVLLGGRVEPRSVSFEHTWGAKRDSLRVDRIGRGLYKIYHAIGHKQYTVVCNAAGNGGHNASYVEIEANYFTIRTNHDNGTYDDVWFSFVVIGENYV